MKVNRLYSADISIDQNRVLLIKCNDRVQVDIKETKKAIDVALEIIAKQPFYLLVDAREILSSMDHESRKYISEHKELNELNIAQAIVVNNISSRIIASAYARFYNGSHKVKIFKRIKDAKEWLADYS